MTPGQLAAHRIMCKCYHMTKEVFQTRPPTYLFIFISCHHFPSRVVVCYSVTQSCLALYDPMGCSMPGFPVFHRLLEFAQTHVHSVGDAIQPSHPPSSPSPPTLNLSQHQGLFQWVSSYNPAIPDCLQTHLSDAAAHVSHVSPCIPSPESDARLHSWLFKS